MKNNQKSEEELKLEAKIESLAEDIAEKNFKEIDDGLIAVLSIAIKSGYNMALEDAIKKEQEQRKSI